MAFITQTHSIEGTFGSKLQTLWTNFKDWRMKRAIYKRTLNELQGLSRRELQDLGIPQSSIRSLAHETAFKN